MFFEKEKIYHVYNRGNNKELIFFKLENYLYFLKKVRKHIFPYCDILCYTLMPNHFHFLIYANEKSISKRLVAGKWKNNLSEGIRTVLSSYTLGINKQEKRTGSLFTQNTKAKPVMDAFSNYFYAELCFYYIIQNPIKANIVHDLKDWEYGSFLDYAGLRNGTLCNIPLAKKLLDIDWENFLYEMNTKKIKQEDYFHFY